MLLFRIYAVFGICNSRLLSFFKFQVCFVSLDLCFFLGSLSSCLASPSLRICSKCDHSDEFLPYYCTSQLGAIGAAHCRRARVPVAAYRGDFSAAPPAAGMCVWLESAVAVKMGDNKEEFERHLPLFCPQD